ARLAGWWGAALPNPPLLKPFGARVDSSHDALGCPVPLGLPARAVPPASDNRSVAPARAPTMLRRMAKPPGLVPAVRTPRYDAGTPAVCAFLPGAAHGKNVTASLVRDVHALGWRESVRG